MKINNIEGGEELMEDMKDFGVRFMWYELNWKGLIILEDFIGKILLLIGKVEIDDGNVGDMIFYFGLK